MESQDQFVTAGVDGAVKIWQCCSTSYSGNDTVEGTGADYCMDIVGN